jgi:hypothetical protein
MNIGLKRPFHPVPEAEKTDTGLRYTDILFGFVIRELFLRLQNWAHIDHAVRCHLIVGATLVLGSWIGFRRSLHRSGYQLKFVNLPLIRFLVDQLMLILYFRIAVLTPVPETGTLLISGPDAARNLARHTNELVFYVFFLYVLWDLLGIWMAKAKIKVLDRSTKPRYPRIQDSEMTDQQQVINKPGIWITFACWLLFGGLWLFADCFNSLYLFVTTAVLLLAYRWLKEMRTSCQLLPQP